MPSTYVYRLLKTSWGVWISLTADARPPGTRDPRAVDVGSGVTLVDGTPGATLDSGTLAMLALGLTSVVKEITPTEIVVLELRYNDCDFQAEGLAAAASGWATAHFGLPPREIPARFDRANNRYVFDLPGLP
ncbi:hypothetical protein [Actinoplanes sp. G11-F43]|uniref:hypothetical protein n=1 Tax=Actinoplanes sp. G11-F43 TaxID=3424130 RepID=UPI003D33C69E